MRSGIRLRWAAFVLAADVCSAGCGPVVFDESVDGLEIVRDRYDIFTISLPLTDRGEKITRLAPEITGNAVRLLNREREEGSRDLFRFEAVSAGDSEIRWRRLEGADRRIVPDHAVKVKVRLSEW